MARIEVLLPNVPDHTVPQQEPVWCWLVCLLVMINGLNPAQYSDPINQRLYAETIFRALCNRPPQPGELEIPATSYVLSAIWRQFGIGGWHVGGPATAENLRDAIVNRNHVQLGYGGGGVGHLVLLTGVRYDDQTMAVESFRFFDPGNGQSIWKTYAELSLLNGVSWTDTWLNIHA